ncbi:hypothetical protein ACPW96_22110 [Micromonospora sp. DT81.3]|uniref:hypothetical protein n=1 Tax=Micromonospora sp. DT81.3 TaxID=3416523 RepID=UPI003CF65A1B
MLLGASFQVQTTAIGYQLATGPGKKGFIAEEPPAEIARLFGETVVASTAAEAAAAAWTDAHCDLDPGPSCGGVDDARKVGHSDGSVEN